MGLLDGILGNVAGSMLGGKQQAQDPLGTVLSGLAGGNARAGGSNPLLQIVLSLLQQNGGLEEVLGKFRQGGLGAQADSWVSTGPNMGISPTQLEQIFGSSAVHEVGFDLHDVPFNTPRFDHRFDFRRVGGTGIDDANAGCLAERRHQPFAQNIL